MLEAIYSHNEPTDGRWGFDDHKCERCQKEFKWLRNFGGSLACPHCGRKYEIDCDDGPEGPSFWLVREEDY